MAASIAEEIKRLELDTPSARRWAREGKIETWVHKYLNSGKGGPTNPAFSEGLRREKRWWRGPLKVALNALSPAVGPDPGMEYVVEAASWEARTMRLAGTLTSLTALPPMIVEYRAGALSLRDGNTRYGAMQHLGWPEAWVVIWYNSEEDYLEHDLDLSR